MKKFILLLILPFLLGCEERPELGIRIPETPIDAKNLQLQTSQQLSTPIEKQVEIANGVTMEFMLIPAGKFHMGSPKSEKERGNDEGPLHQVKISKPFYMGKYEVTQKQYESVMGINRKIKFRGKDLPVENVDWYQAVMYCNVLSNKTGEKIRLPSEAEWEYSCRAGTVTPFYTGDRIEPEQANYNTTLSYNKSKATALLDNTAKVGSYPPNPFGLYDMSGNVWEWCQDIYKSDFYKKSPVADPVNDGRKGSRVIRGGSWNHRPSKLRSADRNKRIQGADRRHIGFRVAMEIE